MQQSTKFKGYALSVRGASHEDDGSPCQDSARVFTAEGFAVAAVSDGHGSEKHFRSASGSEMATRVAIRSICDFAERNNGLDGIFRNDPKNAARRIAANIICGWNNEIAAHIGLFPLNVYENAICEKHGGIPNEVIYGATLIVAGITENGCFGLQIGDGSFLALSGGEMFFPVPEDTKLVGNLTTSLCDSNAIDSFRSFYCEGSVSGVSLSSDGLINSFVNIEDFLKFGKRILSAVESNTATALGEHLKMRSRSGSRDDISVAAIFVNS
ncbi:MAG: protein phosphatase 2C domain-containing protein [Oscillospiraceae bacterium]|nr:protein phosphatase 2C domain-containing protein [Oscillospiraceae bacterium]